MKKKRWTNDDINLLYEYQDDLNPETLSDLAEGFRCSVEEVKTVAQKLGLTVYKGNEWTKAEDDYLKANKATQTNEEIGQALGKSSHSIKRRLHTLGIKRTWEEYVAQQEPEPVYSLDNWNNPWSWEEEHFIKLNYPKKSRKWIAGQLGRSIKSIARRIKLMGLTSAETHAKKKIETSQKAINRQFTTVDDAYIIKSFGVKNISQIAKDLNRTRWLVRCRMVELGLKEPLPSSKPEKGTTEQPVILQKANRANDWTIEEDRYLLTHWKNNPSATLRKVLVGRSKRAINGRAKRLGLYRTQEEHKELLLNPDSLPDSYMASMLAKDPTTRELVLRIPGLLQAKRIHYILTRKFKKE